MLRRTCRVLLAMMTLSGVLRAQAESPATRINAAWIISGVVRDSAGRPLPQATVSVQSPAPAAAPSVAQSVVTDSTGQFVLRWAGSDGVLLTAVHIGFIPRSEFIPRGSTRADTLRHDVLLNRIPVAELPTVITQARRSPSELRRDTPGERRHAEFAMSLDQKPVPAGDLLSIAALAPGVSLIGQRDAPAAGVSIGGQPPSQNQTSVDGASSSNQNLPAEAVASAGVVLNTYDVAVGQFTGGQIVATTRSGTNTWGGVFRTTLAPGALSYGGDESSTRRDASTDVRLGGGGGGAIVPDRFFVYGAVDLSRRSRPAIFLDGGGAERLVARGVSADTLRRFLDVVRSLGLGSSGTATPQATVDGGSALIRFDYALGERHLLTLSLNGQGTAAKNGGASPYSLQASAFHIQSGSTGLMFRLSSYYERITHDLRMSASGSEFRVEPGLAVPGAMVSVASSAVDAGLLTLRAGGNTLGLADHNQRSLEARDEWTWRSRKGFHEWKVGAVLNENRTTSLGRADNFGTFTFANITNLASGSPSSFSRSESIAVRGVVDDGAVYLGDLWTVRDGLWLTMGVRTEWSWYPGVNTDAPASLSVGALRTAPVSEGHVLPRVGATWQSLDGRFAVRGGIGAFRGRIASNGLASAFAERESSPVLTCVGAAAPTPDWSTYLANRSSAPTRCADGAQFFASRLPSVTLFSSTFGAPRIMRGSLEVEWQAMDGVFLHWAASTARGTSEAIAVDRNLMHQVRFVLPEEGNRPVFVPLTAIDPASGGVSITASRLDPRFGTVRELRGSGQSSTSQVSLGVDAIVFGAGVVTAWYTLTQARDVSAGLDAISGASASTDGDPSTTEWGPRSYERRHDIQVSLTRLGHAFSVSLIGRLASGVPFTPSVVGDINGDGQYNDRAFVFNPTRTADTAVANGMARLLGSAAPTVRACLVSQLGTTAARGSCRTGWSPSLDLQVNSRPLRLGSSRITLMATAQNLTAGFDYVLHGANGLRGWGQPEMPDDQLLRVRGFDPSARAFRYDVNAAFGSTGGIRGPRSPFVISVQARITFADPARQAFNSLIAVIRSSPRSEREIRSWLAERFPNVPARTLMLRSVRGLGLTQAQASRLARLSDSLTAPMTAILDSLTVLIVSRAPLNPGVVRPLIAHAEELAELGRAETQRLLLDVQWNKLPRLLRESKSGSSIEPPIRMSIPNP